MIYRDDVLERFRGWFCGYWVLVRVFLRAYECATGSFFLLSYIFLLVSTLFLSLIYELYTASVVGSTITN